MISFEKVYKKFTASYSRSNSPDHNQSGFTLKNLNFQIDTGECVAVIGSNGSGKSTLLKLISSVYKPDGGRVKVIGTCSPIINAGQFFDDEMDLIENINLYGTFSDYKSIDIPVEDIIQKSGLNEYSGLPIKYFSTGMIARASFSIGTAFDFDT
ncbi:ABC transporter ATP-binding protein [bacterium]|nr:ABC transporter ATP-binding protein [bacterium]